MRTVYAVVLAIGTVALVGWIVAHSGARNVENDAFDPEIRWGLTGRRIVAGLFGFGLAGTSAEFAAREISAVPVFLLALLGGGVAMWWAGFAGVDEGAMGEPD